MKKVVLAGPPRSGKSCMREGLKQAIRKIPGSPYPYVITACPDGEGSWFQETVNRDPNLAAACKLDYKSKFSPEFVKRVRVSVKNCSLELTLVDIGGIPSVENEAICEGATHIVILAGDTSKFPEWRKFADKVGLSVVAEIHSDYHGTEDKVESIGEDGILRGSIHRLERGEQVSERPMISALAELLVEKE
jgi:CRISPR-associated protein Csx3